MTFGIQDERATHLMTSDMKLMTHGYGEWVEEPDKVQFTYRGIACEIMRNGCGAFCGYIIISKEHPWVSNEPDVQVHGGITYSRVHDWWPHMWVIGFDCAHGADIRPGALKTLDLPKEVRENMEPDRLEAYENAKKILERLNILWAHTQARPPTYKNIDYVKKEIMKLVDQSLLVSSTSGENK